jgi:SnoaL-like protein
VSESRSQDVNRRDFELLLIGHDPGVELHRAQVFLDVSGIFHGHDGYLEVWRRVLQSFPDFRLDPQELLDLGERVLLTSKLSGHGAGSGMSISQPLFQVFTLRRGWVVRQEDFQDRAEALEAVGLRE